MFTTQYLTIKTTRITTEQKKVLQMENNRE